MESTRQSKSGSTGYATNYARLLARLIAEKGYRSVRRSRGRPSLHKIAQFREHSGKCRNLQFLRDFHVSAFDPGALSRECFVPNSKIAKVRLRPIFSES